jgi:hypothetical protein
MEAAGYFTVMATGQLESAEVRNSACQLAAGTFNAGLFPHRHLPAHPMLLCVNKQISGCSNAYCKYEVVAGEDWQLLDGMESGITQVACQSIGAQDAEVDLQGGCQGPMLNPARLRQLLLLHVRLLVVAPHSLAVIHAPAEWTRRVSIRHPRQPSSRALVLLCDGALCCPMADAHAISLQDPTKRWCGTSRWT